MKLKETLNLLSKGIDDDANIYKYLGLKECSSLDEIDDSFKILSETIYTVYETIPSCKEISSEMESNLDAVYNYLVLNKDEVDKNIREKNKVNVYETYRVLINDIDEKEDNYYKYLGLSKDSAPEKCEYYYRMLKHSIYEFSKRNSQLEDVNSKMINNLNKAHEKLKEMQNAKSK